MKLAVHVDDGHIKGKVYNQTSLLCHAPHTPTPTSSAAGYHNRKPYTLNRAVNEVANSGPNGIADSAGAPVKTNSLLGHVLLLRGFSECRGPKDPNYLWGLYRVYGGVLIEDSVYRRNYVSKPATETLCFLVAVSWVGIRALLAKLQPTRSVHTIAPCFSSCKTGCPTGMVLLVLRV